MIMNLLMKRVFFTVVMLLFPSWSSLSNAQPCLRYEPAVVQLLGQVVLRTFPGPPDYESIRRGDRAETQALLKLDQAICVLGDPKDEINSEAERDQRLVTLVPPSGMNLANYAGAQVRVEGPLFHAHTAHHHTSLLLRVTRITRVGGPRAKKPGIDPSR
jgi:hypothetical protein